MIKKEFEVSSIEEKEVKMTKELSLILCVIILVLVCNYGVYTFTISNLENHFDQRYILKELENGK